MNSLIQSWLYQSAAIFLMLGSIIGMIAGAMMVLRPHRFQRISRSLNHWVSTRNFDKRLESSYSIDPWFYRYRRQSGIAILLGAGYVLYFFVVKLDRNLVVKGLASHFNIHANLTGGVLDAIVLTALIGALCALFVGLFLVFRPSLLRGFERNANQWVSMRKALKPLEIQHPEMEDWAAQHLRQLGFFLMLGGLYTLVIFLVWHAASS